MGLAAVAAVGGVRDGDVSVAGAEFLVEGGFVYDAGTAIIREGGTDDTVATHVTIHGAELLKVFAKEGFPFSLS